MSGVCRPSHDGTFGNGAHLDKLVRRFGKDRIWNMPISEGSFTGSAGSFTGLAIGTAIKGSGPIVDLKWKPVMSSSNAKTPVFSLNEFRRRRDAIQAEMASRGAQLLILDQPEMIFHFAGYAMSEGFRQFCLIPQEGDPLMILRTVDEGSCREFAYIDDNNIIGFRDWDDPIAVLTQVLSSRGIQTARVGIDRNSYSLTLQRFDSLQAALPHASFVDFSDFVINLRACKSPEEIEKLRRSSRIADDAIEALLQEINPTHSARACMALASKHVIRLGGDLGVIGVVTRAIDETKMHAIVDDVPLGDSALLHLELIPQYDGYSSRIMRPIHFGVAPREIKEVAEAIVAIQDQQFQAMKPGAKACDVDAILRDGLLRVGLKTEYRNISGYSLGYYQPFTSRSSDFSYTFRPNDSWTLMENMVFHMYTVAKGMAFSETVVVTPDGGVRLTQTPRRVLEVPATFQTA
ncbi:MAG: M24 family metallopeptidase [Mesorhizobium sp.]|nr:MAG: M24 family metallopeptidase [Mesorhizobium sp.]